MGRWIRVAVFGIAALLAAIGAYYTLLALLFLALGADSILEGLGIFFGGLVAIIVLILIRMSEDALWDGLCRKLKWHAWKEAAKKWSRIT